MMARGGKRKGAGRPKGTGKFGEPTKAVRLPISMIDRIMAFIERRGLLCPSESGNENPPGAIDLMNEMMPTPATSFYVRMDGQAMTGIGIFPGDILIADRNQEPKHGNIVIATVDGKLNVRRLQIRGKRIELKAENPKFSTIKITDEMDFQVLGVVRNAIRSLT